jgi:hypothetical protein
MVFGGWGLFIFEVKLLTMLHRHWNFLSTNFWQIIAKKWDNWQEKYGFCKLFYCPRLITMAHFLYERYIRLLQISVFEGPLYLLSNGQTRFEHLNFRIVHGYSYDNHSVFVPSWPSFEIFDCLEIILLNQYMRTFGTMAW